MTVARVIEKKVEAAYRRGDLFTKRAKMMQEWAAFVDSALRVEEKVVAGPFGRFHRRG